MKTNIRAGLYFIRRTENELNVKKDFSSQFNTSQLSTERCNYMSYIIQSLLKISNVK